jgi:hypothetical protein
MFHRHLATFIHESLRCDLKLFTMDRASNETTTTKKTPFKLVRVLPLLNMLLHVTKLESFDPDL